MGKIRAIDDNRTWIVFANKSRCNHSDAIHDLGYINWVMGENFHFTIGDIVYIFMSDQRRIRYKMIVVAKDCPRTDCKYWNEDAPNDKTYKLALLAEYNKDKLNEEYLLKHGFRGGKSLETPTYNNVELIEYINSVFDKEQSCAIDLKSSPILYVDMYSGRYWNEKIGHEIFNLDKNPIDGKYYGYCPPHGNIGITNLGATRNQKSISGVIVVYTRKIANSHDREIIAFCTNATVYKEPVSDVKHLRKLGRVIKSEYKKPVCPYHIVSDELINLIDSTHKYKISLADYGLHMFRRQRTFSGHYSVLDECVRNYISQYLSGNSEELDFQESIQNADVDISVALLDVSKEMPEYADGNNCKIVKKNSRVSKSVLVNSDYKCAADSNHNTFLTSKGVQYMEGHHLIPCTYNNAQLFWKKRKRNIDCVENIVCLCPNCHRKVHFGSTEEKRKIIELLYTKQIEILAKANLDISLEELYYFYDV